MKKIFYVAAMLALSFCLMFTLTGCAGVYDALNFNRKPLPNPESTVDPTLENKFQREEGSLSKTEFSALASQERETYEDIFRMMYSYYDVNGYYFENSISSTLTNIGAELVPDGKPYARFVEQISGSNFSYGNNYYFAEDTFFGGNGSYYAYEIDDFLTQSNFFVPYRLIDGGGMLEVALKIINERFVDCYKDFNNGAEVLMVSVDSQILNDLAFFFPKEVSPLELCGEFRYVSDILVMLEEQRIIGISLDLVFERASVSFVIKESGEEPSFVADTAPSGPVLPSYLHFVSNMLYGFDIQSNYNYQGFNTKIQLEYTPDASKGYTLPANVSYYYVKNPAARYSAYNAQFIRVLDMDSETLYEHEYTLYLKNNSGTKEIQRDSNQYYVYQDYLNQFSSITNEVFYSDMYNLLNSQIESNQDGYQIRLLSQFSIGQDEYYNEIIASREIILQVNSDFTRLLSASNTVTKDDTTISSIQMTLTYTFAITIPEEVTSYNMIIGK